MKLSRYSLIISPSQFSFMLKQTLHKVPLKANRIGSCVSRD